MTMTAILALGAIAGCAVFLGLPLGRLRNTSSRVRALLNAGATGILIFLFWDVLAKGIAPVERALDEATALGEIHGARTLLRASTFRERRRAQGHRGHPAADLELRRPDRLGHRCGLQP